MEILITHIATNQRGQTQRDQRRIAGPVLAIGRGTDCQISLPDPRVAIAHASITVSAEGSASIKADAGAIEINDQPLSAAQLKVGDRIEIGPYSFQVEAPPAGIPLALAITLTNPLAAVQGNAPRKSPHSKRRLSYLLFFGVLLICLLVPIASDLLSAAGGASRPGFDQVQASSERLSRLWNPGAVSPGHQVFGNDCRACHQLPFVQVRDTACLECHRTIKEHYRKAQLTGSQGATVQETRCAECHRDHKNTQMAQPSQQQCADCHRDIKGMASASETGNVTDFRHDHPPFRLSLVNADQPEAKPQRVRQGSAAAATLVEHSNLKFNHKRHLDPAGVRDPEGNIGVSLDADGKPKRNILHCADCHQAEQGGKLMAPISMEQHCQRCHSLAFEPKLTQRQVPHGSTAAMTTMLSEFYARLALGDVPPDVNTAALDMPRMRPGAVLGYEDRQRVLQIAERKAQLALRELFETRQVCSTCHNVAPTASAGWQVRAVHLARVWMPQAQFSHEKHLTQPCTTCHEVSQSTKAEHIALPDIKKCHECHVGVQPVAGKVTSDCASCHKFHFGRDRWHGAPPVVLNK